MNAKCFQAHRNHGFLIKRLQRIQQLPRDLCQTLHPQIVKEAIDGKVGVRLSVLFSGRTKLNWNGHETILISNREYCHCMSDLNRCSWTVAVWTMLQTILQTTPRTDLAKDNMETWRIYAVECGLAFSNPWIYCLLLNVREQARLLKQIVWPLFPVPHDYCVERDGIVGHYATYSCAFAHASMGCTPS